VRGSVELCSAGAYKRRGEGARLRLERPLSDSFIIHLLGELFRSTGPRRAAARFLLKQARAGIRIAADADRVVLAAGEELGEEVGQAVRELCREAGFCD
jgi:hypothetical protein